MRIAVSPLFALTFAAGCVDAISFVGFGSVFTANMTGNTVLLGIAIVARFTGIHSTLGIVPPLLAVAAFVVGALAAVPMFPAGWDARRAALTVLAEAALVAVAGIAFLLIHSDGAVLFSIALVSFAMGAQSLVAARAGRPGIATTYVTGTIVTAIARGFAHDAKDEHRRESIHNVWIWFVYCAGAAGGALLFAVFHHAGLLPIALVFVIIAFWVDLRGRHYAAQP
jgi:uncharacterized membrane protein YoaK (UPF0700 family)